MHKTPFRLILKINLLLWTAWLFFYALVLRYVVRDLETYGIALFSSINITIPLFFLSLGVWPIVRTLDWRKMSPLTFIASHLLLMNLFTIAWLAWTYGVAYLILDNMLFVMLDVRATSGWQYPQGILKYIMIAGLYYAIIYYFEVKEKELHEAELRLSLRESEWKALKAQINPHFLFNALNSVNALITSNPGSARRMLVALSDLLRHVLKENPTHTISLSRELELLHHYLELEKIRLQDRLSYQENIDPSLLSQEMPAMMLQPLVENAIKHGISQSPRGGWIRLSLERENGTIQGLVENSLAESISGKKGDAHESTGLRNLQQRLVLIYGKDVQFTAQPVTHEKIFRVRFQFPVNNEVQG